jgi:proteasome lid subunit RPN8/RPN11
VSELRLPKDVADAMVEHCISERPNEACGILAQQGGCIVDAYRMRNASSSPVRYSLDPQEQLRVYRELDARGAELGGVFHSHTRTEAYPSPTDVRLATEDVPYLIVSLAKEPPVIRAFRIIKANWTDAEGKVEEIPVVLEGA